MSLRQLLPATDSPMQPNRLPDDDNRKSTRKRARTIIQACNYCRKVKAKCDGKRPKCSTCIAKCQDCGYAGAAGQSRQEAMKSRLQMLEDLFKTLRLESPDEATRLLQRIRSSEDISSTIGHPPSAEDARSSGEGEMTSPSEHSTIDGPPVTRDSSSSESQPPEASLLSVGFSLPSVDMFDKGIEGFFGCSGKLFHVFSEEEVAKYQRHISENSDITVQKAVVCYTAAVAAVGYQYVHESVHENDSRHSERVLYELAKYYFEHVLQTYPLHAIKVCTLLAMYNIMNKPSVALAYVEIGLSLARRHGLDQDLRDKTIPEAFWLNCRKAWRTLMFFSSWLASTLGYISGNDALAHKPQVTIIATQGRRMPLDTDVTKVSGFRFDESSDLGEIVQVEMTKIAILKANILRMNLAFKDLSMLSIQTMMRDLDEWHAALPEAMSIDNLGDRSMPAETRRSIYHVHLLHLGAVILLYRRVASHILQAQSSDTKRNMMSSQLPTIRLVMKDGLLAANNTGRILGLLLAENAVFKRYWLVVFQAYTSCTMLLFAVIRKQLYYLPFHEWKDDLTNARHCLDILESCSSLDLVARKFLEKVQEPYNAILDHMRSPHTKEPSASINDKDTSMGGAEGSYAATPHPEYDSPEEYLFDIPRDSNAALAKSAVKLMEMLCRPFADVDNVYEAENDVKLHLWEDPTRFEYSQLVERLDWDFEQSQPFHWKMEQLSRDLAEDNPLPSVRLPYDYLDTGEMSEALPKPPEPPSGAGDTTME